MKKKGKNAKIRGFTRFYAILRDFTCFCVFLRVFTLKKEIRVFTCVV